MTLIPPRHPDQVIVHRPGAALCVVLEDPGDGKLSVRCPQMRRLRHVLGHAPREAVEAPLLPLHQRKRGAALLGRQEAVELRDALDRWLTALDHGEAQ